MRGIKFRAWDKRNLWMDDEMFIDANGNVYDRPSVTYDTPHTEIELIENYILMQFTGLTDKDGIEIYEGDITQTICEDGTKLSKFEMIWHNYGWAKKREDGEIFNISSKLEIKHHLVIGNIHQNPELLER